MKSTVVVFVCALYGLCVIGYAQENAPRDTVPMPELFKHYKADHITERDRATGEQACEDPRHFHTCVCNVFIPTPLQIRIFQPVVTVLLIAYVVLLYVFGYKLFVPAERRKELEALRARNRVGSKTENRNDTKRERSPGSPKGNTVETVETMPLLKKQE